MCDVSNDDFGSEIDNPRDICKVCKVCYMEVSQLVC